MEESVKSPDTLLIVDDCEINRTILAEIFRPYYRISEAGNGQEGMEKILAGRHRICAVLLDVMMPVMSGIEMLRALKRLGLLEQLPVFLITSDPNDAVTREAYELGVMDVSPKPVVPYVATRRVNSIVELFQARRRLASTVEEQQTELYRQMQRILDLDKGMIEALAASIEFRSNESGEHVHRIRDITRLMLEETAFAASVPREEIEWIALAAVMHDVGKIAIPDAVLNKPGRLTAQEFEIMKTHTVQGCRILERIPQMQENAVFHYAHDIARHHHERWDGGGYPDGLRGEEISLWAQVVSIADVYDALVSSRGYKSAMTPDCAVELIRSGKCGVFNPKLLESFFFVEPRLRAFYESDGVS